MTQADREDKVINRDSLGETPSASGKRPQDIMDALKVTGHFTTRYPNGLTLGVRMESIPGTRGVHVDVVFVLDLREAVFGKSGLAMRAAVLESINRTLPHIMLDVGLDEFMQEQSALTPWGRVILPLLKSAGGKSTSLIHETRTVYVITADTKPTMDLTWLTDTGRVVTPAEFVLVRRSDARSSLPNLKKSVTAAKWSLLENGLTRGWFGVLSLVCLMVGISAALSVLLLGSGSLIPPLATSALSGLIGGWLLHSSRKSIHGFLTTVSDEQKLLDRIGDAERISQSILDNEDKLTLIGDLNFVISPLIATAGRALEEGDVDAAVRAACIVLDECVRLAPIERELKSNVIKYGRGGDEGLRRFLGLFEELGGVEDEESLAVTYVGLTGHVVKAIDFSEAVTYLTELNNALYHIGALRPDIKESIDDHLNRRAMKQTVEEIDKQLAIGQPDISSELVAPESETSEETLESEEDEELHDMIRSASVNDMTEDSSNDIDSEMKVTAADVVIAHEKKRKKKVGDTQQLSLIDEFELAETTEEEGGSASV